VNGRIAVLSGNKRFKSLRCGNGWLFKSRIQVGDNNYPAEDYTETEVTAFPIPAHIFHRCLE
jgi:CRP/FNR family transcriptional regulator